MLLVSTNGAEGKHKACSAFNAWKYVAERRMVVRYVRIPLWLKEELMMKACNQIVSLDW
nr:hypothetical protein [uncultured Prevotella sp.]